MKKSIVILLLVIYSSATMGATIHMHFCMNELVGWSLVHDDNDTCGRCGMDDSDMDGCCRDEFNFFKLNTDHQKSNIDSTTPAFSSVIVTPETRFNFNFCKPVAENFPACHAPPDIGTVCAQILYCTFLI